MVDFFTRGCNRLFIIVFEDRPNVAYIANVNRLDSFIIADNGKDRQLMKAHPLLHTEDERTRRFPVLL